MLVPPRIFSNRVNLWLGWVFPLILPGVFWGLPSAFSPQDDSPFPLRPLLFLAEYSKSHLNTVYPPFHQLLVLPVYGIVFVFYWLSGGVSHVSSTWPYGLRNVSAFFSVLILVTNLVSSIMAIFMLRASFRFVERSRKWLWFSLLMVGTNGVFVYYARVGNLDIPYNFWWALTLVCLWRFLIGLGSRQIFLFMAGATAALSAASKDQAAGLIVGSAFLLLLFAPGALPSLHERIRNTFAFGLTIGVTYPVTAILPQPVRWWNHARFVTSPHAPTQIPLSLSGELKILWVTLRQLHHVFGIPFLVLAILGTVVLFRSGKSCEFWLLVLPLVGYYVVIIAKTRVDIRDLCSRSYSRWRFWGRTGWPG